MRSLIIRLSLFLLAVILFITCLIFLLVDHADNFIRFVPAGADIYLHSEKNILTVLPALYKPEIESWLMQNGVKQEVLKAIAQYNDELGIYKDLDGITFITKDSTQLKKTLAENKILFVVYHKMLFFPKTSLNLEQASLNSERQAFNFADFTIYAKNIIAILPQLISLKTGELDRLTINGALEKDKLLLSIKHQTELSLAKPVKPAINSLPTDTKFYFANLDTKTGLTLINSNPQNLNYQILKNLAGPVEYLETGDQTTIIVQNQANSDEEIGAAIKSGLAQLLPTEESKTLPDGTESVQFVAKPDKWKLASSVDKNNQQIKTIDEPRLGINIEIQKAEKASMIRLILRQKDKFAQNNLNPTIKSPCVQDKFAKTSVIYLNIDKEVSMPFLNSILIRRQNNHKTTICID